MAEDNTKNMTSDQAQNKNMNRNPTGKGGFADHPENINPGGWEKKTTQRYLLERFLEMSVEEFRKWEKEKPEKQRTVAESLAYARAVKARDDLANYKEVVDRTEGKPPQSVDMTTQGEKITGPIVYIPSEKKENGK